MHINPYQNLRNGRWIKANFHTHAGTGPGTCGSNPVEDVVGLYRRLGFGALCVSNHDLYTDTSALGDENLFMVQGVEYSAHPHMLTLGIKESLHALSHQEAIRETNARGGFAVLCHPNWQRKEYWPRTDLDALAGYAGIEVVNMLIYRLSGSGLATDTWDYLLRQGKLVFGFGNDDYHNTEHADRAFNEIYVCEDGFNGIKNAVLAGAFTASTGLSLDYLMLDNNTVRVKVKFPTSTYATDFTYRFVTENGPAKTVLAETAEFRLSNEHYVRVEAIAENGAMLFTQPIFRNDVFEKP